MERKLLSITAVRPKEILRRNIPRVYAGDAVLKLPPDLLVGYATKICSGLNQNGNRMRPLDVDNILDLMMNAQSVLVIDNGKLCAYSHLIDSKDEDGNFVPRVKEAGAWLSFEQGGNYGVIAMRTAAKLALEQGAEQVIALVHQDNPANDVIEKKVGAKYLKTRQSNYVRDEKNPSLFAMMNVYDLTKTGREQL